MIDHISFQSGHPHILINGMSFKYSTVWISQFSRSVVSDYLRPHGLQHARPPCPSPTSGVHSNSCALSRGCPPTISRSVVPFSSCPWSLPASGSFSSESVLHIRWPEYWSTVCIVHSLFTFSLFVCGHFFVFQYFVILNNATVKTLLGIY